MYRYLGGYPRWPRVEYPDREDGHERVPRRAAELAGPAESARKPLYRVNSVQSWNTVCTEYSDAMEAIPFGLQIRTGSICTSMWSVESTGTACLS
jgi:hypothetical protein